MPAAPQFLTVSRERMVRHGFADRPCRTVAAAAAHTVALQAQDAQAARLGVRSRSTDMTEADVVRAIDVERSVVRTSLMRATIHLVAAADAGWLTALIGPAVRRKFAKRWRDLGLTDALLDRTAAALPELLGAEPRTRGEILAGWRALGLDLPNAVPLTESPTHALLHATTLGLVCRGPDRGREPTFVLLDAWAPGVPDGPRGDDALAELARRYFRAFSPATAADFTTWSGLPSGRALGLIRDELTAVDVAGRPGFRMGPAEARAGVPGAVRLVSGFDNYLVGYRDKDATIDEAHRPAVYANGVIRPTVLVDGRVAGSWRLDRSAKGRTVTVAVRMFRRPNRREIGDIEAEAADIGRFVGGSSALELN